MPEKHNHEKHSHNHDNHNHGLSKNILLSFILNTTFACIELTGGIITNSQAIISDSIHDFGDSISLGLSYFLEKKSTAGRTEEFNYGTRRLSLLSGLISGCILISGSIVIIISSIPRLLNPEKINFQGVIWIALFGVVINGMVYLKNRKEESLNGKMVSWHFLEDALGWIAVLISGIINLFVNLPILDSSLAIAIAFFTLYRVTQNLIKIYNVFMQKSPKDFDRVNFEKLINDDPNILTYHDLNIWSLDGQKHILSVHLVLKENTANQQINILKDALNHNLEKLNVNHCTIETEFKSDNCHKKYLEN